MTHKTTRVLASAVLSLYGVSSLMSAGALVKNVGVWGAYSANDMGGSDTRITMEDLEADHKPYLQTDDLTEYFHKDADEPYKDNLGEELSWLIDNGILSRDQQILVTTSSGTPSVTITKADLSNYLVYDVKRSDLIMYLYRAVYGKIYGRTIALETDNFRSDDGTLRNLSSIINSHSDGWSYPPQGDKYSSVFGDTNFFFSKVDIDTLNNSANDHSSATIDYETDYKKVLVNPRADLIY